MKNIATKLSYLFISHINRAIRSCPGLPLVRGAPGNRCLSNSKSDPPMIFGPTRTETRILDDFYSIFYRSAMSQIILAGSIGCYTKSKDLVTKNSKMQIVTILTHVEPKHAYRAAYNNHQILLSANSPQFQLLSRVAPQQAEYHYFMNYPAINGGPFEALHGPHPI